MTIKTIVVDDHKLVRRGLCALLKDRPDIEVVGEADNGRDAIVMVEKLAPRLVIMDPSMPGLNGADATGQIKHEFPKVKVIALSMHSDRRFVSKMLSAGASAYLLKSCDEDELFRAIDLVMDGKTYLSPDVTGMVVEEMVNPSQTNTKVLAILSGREREILQLVAEGKSAKEIGTRLNVSARTIDSHRSHIMAKLELYTVADLTKYAVKVGLTPL